MIRYYRSPEPGKAIDDYKIRMLEMDEKPSAKKKVMQDDSGLSTTRQIEEWDKFVAEQELNRRKNITALDRSRREDWPRLYSLSDNDMEK